MSKKPKKKGPKPNANEHQLRKARQEGGIIALQIAQYIQLNHDVPKEDITAIYTDFPDVADSLEKQYITMDDIVQTLEDELGIRWVD